MRDLRGELSRARGGIPEKIEFNGRSSMFLLQPELPAFACARRRTYANVPGADEQPAKPKVYDERLVVRHAQVHPQIASQSAAG
jgi:hypothetical protein